MTSQKPRRRRLSENEFFLPGILLVQRTLRTRDETAFETFHILRLHTNGELVKKTQPCKQDDPWRLVLPSAAQRRLCIFKAPVQSTKATIGIAAVIQYGSLQYLNTWLTTQHCWLTTHCPKHDGLGSFHMLTKWSRGF